MHVSPINARSSEACHRFRFGNVRRRRFTKQCQPCAMSLASRALSACRSQPDRFAGSIAFPQPCRHLQRADRPAYNRRRTHHDMV